MFISSNYKCLLASTSTLHNQAYLDYLLPELEILFGDVDEILFIPFARPSGITHDAYTKKANEAFAKIGKTCVGLHSFSNPTEAIQNAKGIFTGGGNSFVLLNAMYERDLLPSLKHALEIIKHTKLGFAKASAFLMTSHHQHFGLLAEF
jgi:dipeptidase E